MPGQSILYAPGYGYPGASTRPSHSTIEPVMLDSAKPFADNGLPGKKTGGKFVPLEEGDTADVIYGIRVRSYPFMSDEDVSRQLSTPYNHTGDVMVRGYIAVKVNAGTPAEGGKVWVRVKGETSDKPLGGFEAAADATAGNTVELKIARFMGNADADGIAEIAFNI
ncbi:hypothetical protein NXJ56_001021 [Salmonella enterica]|nr:hypothetical protein [Salmonella enterica]EJR6244225.1 hypothetical protein [Salmonella enterica]